MSFDDDTEQALPDHWVTTLHLFRHGRVQTGDQRVCRGHVDVPLSERGLAQSQAVARFCAGLGPIDGVVTSDLSRARVMAQAVSDETGAPLVVTPALREQHMGDWEGRSWQSLQQTHRQKINDYWDDYLDARPPGGESYRQLTERIEVWLADWAPTVRDQRWVVCSHIGVVRWLLCRTLGLPPDQALRFAPGYASYSRMLWADAGGVIEVMGASVSQG